MCASDKKQDREQGTGNREQGRRSLFLVMECRTGEYNYEFTYKTMDVH